MILQMAKRQANHRWHPNHTERFATWVYWEEIFGRGTRFRAFWWSPDNKTIAYMRFDENKIKPCFPLYASDGTHGFLEETRYPKAGDPTLR
jgi:dipeptidyl-peptidase 4